VYDLTRGIDFEKSGLILLSSCFFLNLISGTIRGLRPMFTVWMHESYMQNLGFYRSIFYVAHFSLSVVAVLIGFIVGRRGAVERKHRDYAVALLVGGALAPVLLGLVSLVIKDEVLGVVTQIGSETGLGGAVSFSGKIFTGVALAWLHKGGAVPKPTWETRVVLFVASFQVWSVTSAVIRVVLTRRVMSGSMSVGRVGGYLVALSLVGLLVSLAYFFYLFKAGQVIDVGERYAGVVFSLYVPKVVGEVVVGLIGTVGSGVSVQQVAVNVASEIIGSTIGVFGTGFAVVSYAYFREKGFRSPFS